MEREIEEGSAPGSTAFTGMVEACRGSSVIRYSSAIEQENRLAGPVILGTLPISELALDAGIEDGSFDSIADAFILANGWQSWSPSWELGSGEKMGRVRFIENLNLHNERPQARPRFPGEIVSHFLVWFRKGDRFLALVSTRPDGAPVAFRVDRRRSRLAFEAWAVGKRYAKGEEVAEIHVLSARDFFTLRDVVAALFPASRFDRLAFLGDPARGAKEGDVAGGRLVPGGYESWYNHYSAIDEALILDDLGKIDGNANLINSLYISKGRPTVFQVDDGWERRIGDWRVDEGKFPHGMGAIASAARAKGLVPGLWFAPFLVTKDAPVFTERPGWLLRDEAGEPVVAGWMPHWGGDFHVLDLSKAEVLDYLEGLVRTAVDDWGFRYLKLDFLYAGALPGAWAEGGTVFEVYRRALTRLVGRERNARGEPIAFLGCGAPLELSWGSLPLMRIGADTLPAWDDARNRLLGHMGRPSAWLNMKDTIGRCLLDRSVFVSDPDVVFTRTDRIKLGDTEKELVALVARLFASQVMFSENPSGFDAAEEAFTRRIVALYGAVGDAECAALRLPGFRDVYRVVSRDGSLSGVVNLGDRAATIEGGGMDGDWLEGGRIESRAIVLHAIRGGHGLRFAPRSISLWRSGSP